MNNFIKKFVICFGVAVLLNGMFFSAAFCKMFGKNNTNVISEQAVEVSENQSSDVKSVKTKKTKANKVSRKEKKEKQSKEDKKVSSNKKNTNEQQPKLFEVDKSLAPFSMSVINGNNGLQPIQASVESDEKASDNLELKSETVDFYPETRQYIAKNNAELIIRNQKVRMTANEIIVDQKNYSIIGIGNVKIIKDNDEYFGDYIKIDTKKESSFLTRPIFYFDEMTVIAKTASMYASDTFFKDGDAVINKKAMMLVQTSGFGGVDSSRFFDPKKLKEGSGDRYRIVAKQITVKREKEKNNIYMKGANIYLGKVRIAYAPNLVIAADKDVSYVETTVPEMGNRSKIGTFIAPSVVLGLPGATTLKAGPLLALKDSKFGVGAFARISSPNNRVEAMYSSATGNLLLNGHYKLTNEISLDYVVNDYIDSGWMGGMMPYYGVELSYEKEQQVPQANTWIKNKVSAGFFKDVHDYFNDPHGTMRYRWLSEAINMNPLFGWKNYLMLGYRYQHDISLYQTGDFVGVARVGPRIYSDLGRLYLEVDYLAAGQYGESPFFFDRYRYGKNNVTFRGQWYVNKYLSLAYLGSTNLSGRDYDDNWLAENQFIVAVGTDDIKMRLGFDTIRSTTTIGLDLLLGSNKTLVEFDEMKVQDFDRISDGKQKKEDRKKLKKQKQLKKEQKLKVKNQKV